MNKKTFIWRWGPVVIWCAFIFWLSSIPHLAINDGPSDLILRKTAHMTEYAILFCLVYRAFAVVTKVWNWKLAVLSLALTVLYAVTDELHQHYVTGRHGAILDIGIDTIGTFIGMAAVGWWQWWNRALNVGEKLSK